MRIVCLDLDKLNSEILSVSPAYTKERKRLLAVAERLSVPLPAEEEKINEIFTSSKGEV